MSRNESRQRLAREYRATDIVEARGDEGVAAIKELTNGLGAHSVVEAVGLIDLIWNRQIDPGKVFDLELPSTMPPTPTARWTSARQSRCSCAPERGQ